MAIGNRTGPAIVQHDMGGNRITNVGSPADRGDALIAEFTETRVPYSDADGILTESADLAFDEATSQLQVNAASATIVPSVRVRRTEADGGELTNGDVVGGVALVGLSDRTSPAEDAEARISGVLDSDMVALDVSYDGVSQYRATDEAIYPLNEYRTLGTETYWWSEIYVGTVHAYTADVPGVFLLRTILTSGSSTHYCHNLASIVHVCGVGAGGGGGGASFSTPNGAFGAGGASGGFFDARVSVSGSAGLAYAIGTAGAAGSSSAGTGGTGGDTTITIGGTTYTAKGGLGGVGMANGSTVLTAVGGAGVAGTNGDLLSPGASGGSAIRTGATAGVAGEGAPSVFGGGGASRATDGVGNNGTGYGSGGGGGAGLTTSRAGGAGAAGVLIIEEYA